MSNTETNAVSGTPNRPSVNVGDVVRYRIPAHRRHQINGAEWAPAIVTRVWGPSCFNVKVLPDCAEPFDASSVSYGYGDPDSGRWIVGK